MRQGLNSLAPAGALHADLMGLWSLSKGPEMRLEAGVKLSEHFSLFGFGQSDLRTDVGVGGGVRLSL